MAPRPSFLWRCALPYVLRQSFTGIILFTIDSGPWAAEPEIMGPLLQLPICDAGGRRASYPKREYIRVLSTKSGNEVQ